MKLYPRCHPTSIDHIKQQLGTDKKIVTRGLAYISTGHLLPCCWCDYNGNTDFDSLLTDELKLKNFNSVKELLLTKEWVSFHKILFFKPEEAPEVCRKKCSKKSFEIEVAEDE
jgi:hypothetical protein